MTGWGRIVVLAIGGLLILLGLLHPPGIGPILLGVVLILSCLFEGRYRKSGSADAALGPGWEKTGETFRDEESGDWMQVWFHRETGERRYLPRSGSS